MQRLIASLLLSCLAVLPATALTPTACHQAGIELEQMIVVKTLAAPLLVNPHLSRFTSENHIHPIFAKSKRNRSAFQFLGMKGEPVYAPASGRVLYSGSYGGYGKTVILDHGDGIATMYAHLDKLFALPNDTIPAGGSVGSIGNTGYSTGPRLLFEVRIDGRHVME